MVKNSQKFVKKNASNTVSVQSMDGKTGKEQWKQFLRYQNLFAII